MTAASDLLARLSASTVEAEICRRSLPRFIAHVWDVVEPTRALMPSIAFDAIAAALTAVADGRIKRLGIACPPGIAKSKLASVIFPAWLMLRTGGRSRVMSGSYGHDLATRDSRATRDLVNSERFGALVRSRWATRSDVGNQEDDWTTTSAGRRQAVSIGSATTGDRATMQILDDLLSARDAHSPAKRRDAIHWLTHVLPSRLEDQQSDPRVLIGQRLHILDPMSVAIEQEWRLLVLPAVLGPCPELGIADEYEPCVLLDDNGREVWRDTRQPGEPLVSLLGIAALVQLKREMGTAAFLAQYQQRPVDESASMFPRSWFARRWHRAELPESFDAVAIALDASFKASSSSDYAVIQAWGAKGGDRFLLEQWRRQAGFVDTLGALRSMAQRYPYAKILVEGAANGHAVLDQLKREIAGVVEVKPEGGKVARAASVQAIVESGAVVLPANAPWVEAWLDEVCAFPAVKNDDQTDAMTYGLRALQLDDAVSLLFRAVGMDRDTGKLIVNQEDVAADLADRARRKAKLDRLEAKRAAGGTLTRAEALHLKMWRRKSAPT